MKKLIFLLLLIPLIGLSNQKDSIYTKVSVNKDTIYIAMDTDIGKLIYNIWVTKPLPKQPTIIKTTQKWLENQNSYKKTKTKNFFNKE